MALYKLDFFNRADLINVHHDVVGSAPIDDDYISAGASSITIGRTEAVKKGMFLRITGDMNHVCLVSDVDNGTTGLTTISVKPFITLFDVDVLFDTDTQSDGSALETVLSDLITSTFISSSDSLQNIPMTVTTTSSTTHWGFNLKSDTEGMHRLVTNLYSTLIAKSLSKYGVSITPSFDFTNRTISLTIGTVTGNQLINADLKNVVIKTFKYREPSTMVNKLTVWNAESTTENVTYYLHSDGSYDTTDDDRVYPVVPTVKTVQVSTDSTFAATAASTAASELGGIEWSNLIQIEVSKTDMLINPMQLQYGQMVTIWHDGAYYNSILTGRTLSDLVVLTFGTVRTRLTKKIKLGG